MLQRQLPALPPSTPAPRTPPRSTGAWGSAFSSRTAETPAQPATGTGCTGPATGHMLRDYRRSTQQVQNPVATLPADNNGVVLQFPSVSYEGASSVSGYLILGIGTEQTLPRHRGCRLWRQLLRGVHHGLQRHLSGGLPRHGVERSLLPRREYHPMRRLVLPLVRPHPIGRECRIYGLAKQHGSVPDRELQHPQCFEQRIPRPSAPTSRVSSTGGFPSSSEETSISVSKAPLPSSAPGPTGPIETTTHPLGRRSWREGSDKPASTSRRQLSNRFRYPATVLSPGKGTCPCDCESNRPFRLWWMSQHAGIVVALGLSPFPAFGIVRLQGSAPRA